MNIQDCEKLQDLLPGYLQGTLEPEERDRTEAHLSTCQACQRELDLLTTILRARPEPPPELEARIQARLRMELPVEEAPMEETPGKRSTLVFPLFGRRFPLPSVALPAAAMVILALGTAVLWNSGAPEVEQEPIQVVQAEEPLPEAYLWDDGVVAGAPLFDGLTEDDLLALLEDLEGEA